MPGTDPRSNISTLVYSSLIPFAAALLIATGALADSGHGAAAVPSEAAQARALDAQAMTLELVGQSRRLENASTVGRARLQDELVALAEERQALLGAMIGEDPGAVLKVALPDRLQAHMPPEVLAFVEQRVELEGELQVLHIDAVDPSQSGYAYFLETYDGERFSLHFAKEPRGLLTGTEVRAKGLLLESAGPEDLGATDGSMALESGDDDLLMLAAGGEPVGGTSMAPALPDTLGEQRVAVIMVNFQDKATEPYTTSQVADVVLGTPNEFFLENSYGQTWLTGDVYGWYTLPLDSSSCKISDIYGFGEQAALDNGVNLSNYNRHVYILGPNSCPFSGLGSVGGNPSKSLIKSLFWWTVAHELGHNVGLFHSNALDCGTGVRRLLHSPRVRR